MESLDELTKVTSGKPGFFKHVFNFDEQSKSEMMNIIQYAVLAIIPVVIFNKLMQRFVPEADEEKKSLEIVAEVLAQIIVMFLVILIIHRIVTYIPPYSGENYANFSVTNIILAMLVIILSLQTKLGEKVSILVDRIIELWEGPKDQKKKGKKGNGNVKVTQPIMQGQQNVATMGQTSITNLPPPEQNFDQMYRQDTTPLVGAATPGMENFETGPVAANSMGGGAFGSAFGW
jgi:hypothetical protein